MLEKGLKKLENRIKLGSILLNKYHGFCNDIVKSLFFCSKKDREKTCKERNCRDYFHNKAVCCLHKGNPVSFEVGNNQVHCLLAHCPLSGRTFL